MEQGSRPPAGSEGHVYGVPRRRERVIALLSEAYARGDLEQDEFERRVEGAERSRTIEELDAVIADFPADMAERGSARDASAGTVILSGQELEREVARLEGLEAPMRFRLLGDMNLTVEPSEPRVLKAVSVIGDAKVDLRALSGLPGAFLVKVASLMGDTKILVPRGTRVEIRMLTLLGDQRRGTRDGGFLKRIARGLGAALGQPETPRRPGPTVVVTGFKALGDTRIIEE